MNVISRDDPSVLDRADSAGSSGTEPSTHPSTGRHPAGHLLLCALGMLAALVGVAVVGFGAASLVALSSLFCAAMMLSMVWMMAGPAIRKLRRTEHH
jgi:hypothetical protein